MTQRAIRGTICVDFDGTIVEHKYPKIGELKPDAVEAVNKLYDAGWEIIIYSCRMLADGRPTDMFPDTFHEIKPFLDAAGLKYDRISTREEGKPFASWYIDDRAIAFNDNWLEIASKLT